MPNNYSEICKTAEYTLTGNGARRVRMLLESFEQVDPATQPDFYGSGSMINDFEQEVAALLGKESAVFFPSGTMAQQIAVRIWSDEAGLKKAAYHPLCHLEIHERDGLKMLHHIDTILLGSSDRLFTLEDLKAVNEPVACLLIELPQREIGGQLPAWEELVAISEFCKNKGIRLHLDGARLFEVLPYYGRSAGEICSLFDSVYVSFYKGLGGIAGAMLAGAPEFIEQSKAWKRRHGGDLISLYPYIVNARYSMNKRMGKMKNYWEHAKKAAELLNSIQGIRTLPEVPVCNMFHAFLDVSKETAESIFAGIIREHKLALITSFRETSATSCRSELTFGDSFEFIPQSILDAAFRQLAEEFRRLKSENSL